MSILASSLALGGADYRGVHTLCVGTPTPSCSSRSARQGTAISRSSGPRPCAASAASRSECLDFALATNQDSGIWGGLSEEERRVIRRQRGSPPRATPRRGQSAVRRLTYARPALTPAHGSTTVRRAAPPSAPTCPADRRRGARARRPRGPSAWRSHRDRAVELGGDERAHDRQAEPGRRLQGEGGSSPLPSSMTSTASSSPSLCSETTTLPPPLPSGNPWSTAFCISSVSTTDSGVATRAGMRPPSPASVNSIGRSGDCRLSSARRSSGRTISMNVTSSPGSRDSDSCTRAMVRIRRTDSAIAAFASGLVEPPALQAQQRRDRLQVVLHPVVDLADRRVLAHQQAIALAEVGDVAYEQHAADHLAGGQDRHAPAEQHDVGRLLELLDHRRLVLEGAGAPHRRRSRARTAASRPRWPGCRRGALPSWRSGRGSAPAPRRRR